jgi:hypothetical protein
MAPGERPVRTVTLSLADPSVLAEALAALAPAWRPSQVIRVAPKTRTLIWSVGLAPDRPPS